MRKITAIVLFLMTGSAGWSAHRLDGLAATLARQADALAGDHYRGFNSRTRGSRTDVEGLFLVQQFAAAAGLFQQLVEDRRQESELRDGVSILWNLARTADRVSFGRRQWRDIDRTLDELGRELGRYSGTSPTPAPARARSISGRMRWRGNVDDSIYLSVRDKDVSVQVISGQPASNVTSHFTSPLPQRPVSVEVRKIKGRGSINVIQEPSPDNDSTAVIHIRDEKGSWAEYDFELVWYY